MILRGTWAQKISSGQSPLSTWFFGMTKPQLVAFDQLGLIYPERLCEFPHGAPLRLNLVALNPNDGSHPICELMNAKRIRNPLLSSSLGVLPYFVLSGQVRDAKRNYETKPNTLSDPLLVSPRRRRPRPPVPGHSHPGGRLAGARARAAP